MEIKIHTSQLELTEVQEALVLQKIEKLTHLAQKLSDESSEIRVDLLQQDSKSQDDAFVCHVTMFVPQDKLRAEAQADTLENVVDEVVEKMRPQIERYKDKMHHISDRH